MPMNRSPSAVQKSAGNITREKECSSLCCEFPCKGNIEGSEYLGYLRIVGKSELLNTKNKEKPLNLLKLITAAGSSSLKVSFKMR